MTEMRTFRLRVTYGKMGRLAMLSHLEVTHALERMVRRAKLPFALSQGFSPHMKISFGSALPVAVGGTQEIFDILLTDYIAPAKALEALAASAPEDLMPIECKYVEPKAKAASVAFPFSVYEAQLASPPESLEIPETIEVVRKKKTRVLNVADYLVTMPQVDDCSISFQLRSSESGSLRPDVLINELTDPSQVISITRVAQSESAI